MQSVKGLFVSVVAGLSALAGANVMQWQDGKTPFLIAPFVSTSKPPTISGRASVIDGDTIEIHGRAIRFHGLDSVEGRQHCQKNGKPWRCGRAAAMALADKIGAANVKCYKTTKDYYGRMVARCAANGIELNSWLVLSGWALAFRRYSKEYIDLEKQAKAAKRGLWSGEFIPPWEWRKKKRKGLL